MLSGGVSMGKFDLVPKVLQQLGVQEVFHKIAQRPGRPMWFGIGPQGQAVFGLPGNPVSTLVCLIRYVIPAIAEAMGTKRAPPERLALAAPVTFQQPLAYFLPVAIEHDDWGRPWANPRPPNGSGDFLSLAGTDGFVELPPGPNTYPKGFVATRLPLVAAAMNSTVHHIRGPQNPLDRLGRPLARFAHLGHGPMQLSLPLLHAEGAISRALSILEIAGTTVLR